MLRLILALGFLMLGLAPRAALAGSQTGHVSVAIGEFIAIVENKSINFASMMPTAAGGNVVLSTAGGITAPGGFALVGTPNAGAFTASSFAGFPAVVTFNASTTLSDGAGHTMTLATFTNNAPAAFNAAGNLPFNVGATLTVGANQAPGTYTGTYTVTVNW
jgi:Mat/Ecp fimbriae major subunit